MSNAEAQLYHNLICLTDAKPVPVTVIFTMTTTTKNSYIYKYAKEVGISQGFISVTSLLWFYSQPNNMVSQTYSWAASVQQNSETLVFFTKLTDWKLTFSNGSKIFKKKTSHI